MQVVFMGEREIMELEGYVRLVWERRVEEGIQEGSLTSKAFETVI